MNCPCGRDLSLSDCCGPFLKGTKYPATAEDLMRSRYTAYVLGNVDYILSTHHEKTRDEVDRDSVTAWSVQSEWLGIEILHTEGGGCDDTRGVVEFAAQYTEQGHTHTHHERSRFEKDDDRWYYVDGTMIKPEPVVRTVPKVGRNDPCPCGSGAKFKKCCGKLS